MIIHKLFALLTMIKDFDAGYSSKNRKSMIVSYKNKVYRLDISEVGEGEITNKHLNLL